MSAKKIVLTMIVKNEAHVIERCLASTLPVIDTWVIVDTGSTDGTQQKIKDFFSQIGIEGKLYERPWVDFGTNRSELLELSRPEGDYSLMIDADEILEFDGNFDPNAFKESLTADLYSVFAIYGGIKYHRPQLTANRLPFYYRGVCHEYVDCHEEIKTKSFANGFINRPIQDGARSKDPEKYKRDAKLFEDALNSGKTDPKDFNRYHFYLAQSYRDAQMPEKAIEWYLKRANLGGWNEEVFYSLFQVAIIKEAQKAPVDEIIRYHLEAFNACPFRAESLWIAAKLCRSYGRFHQAYTFAKKALSLPYPEGGLFVLQPVYDWMVLDEFATAAFWTENFRECKIACEKMLNDGKLPQRERERIEINLRNAINCMLRE